MSETPDRLTFADFEDVPSPEELEKLKQLEKMLGQLTREQLIEKARLYEDNFNASIETLVDASAYTPEAKSAYELRKAALKELAERIDSDNKFLTALEHKAVVLAHEHKLDWPEHYETQKGKHLAQWIAEGKI